MLYLTRKAGESIIVNETISITVVETRGGSVKLGFEFPPTASVLRKEIHDRIKSENMEAATLDFSSALEEPSA